MSKEDTTPATAPNKTDGTPKGNKEVANVPAAATEAEAKAQAERVAADDKASRDPSSTSSEPTEGAKPGPEAVDSPNTGKNDLDEATPSARESARPGTATASEAPNANHNTGGNIPTSDVSNSDAPVDTDPGNAAGMADDHTYVEDDHPYDAKEGFRPKRKGAKDAKEKLMKMAESITSGTPLDHTMFGYAGQVFTVEDLLHLTGTSLK